MSRKICVDLLSDGDVEPVGCRISRGQLIPALSPVKIGNGIPGKILCAGRAESAGRFFIADSEKVYVSVTGEEFYELGSLSGDSPFMFEEVSGGVARAVICNGNHALVHTGAASTGLTCGANYSCGVMHCGRLFGADGDDGYTLRWSGEGGIEDGEEKIYGAGYLILEPKRGKILDILEFGEKLVLVRERGLTLLSMFGMPENFSVEPTDTDTDAIFKGTAQTVCGKLIFFTESGLKSFDGSRVEELTHAYADSVSEPTCSAAFTDEYFLGCTCGKTGGRCVLCYCVQDGESYIIDVAADAISASDCVYVFGTDGVFRLRSGGQFSFTARTDFKVGGYKTLTEIYVGGVADIGVSNGNVSRLFSSASGKIRPRIRGRSFTVTGGGTRTVKSLTAYAEVSDDV